MELGHIQMRQVLNISVCKKEWIYMEKLIHDISDWLHLKTTEANAKGLLVGVSGGLDSAVVTHLIKHAFPQDSLGVIMPIDSNPRDLEDAENVIKTANINVMNVDLTLSHQQMYRIISGELKDQQMWHEKQNRIADANLRARLRMSTLYTIATHLNYLVVGTDNAAEWYTGYFTKYGDGGVDLQPIIQLTKHEVREMARHLQVPSSIIEKNPSADLWTGQTDEDEMGTSYAHIDAFLNGETIPEQDYSVIEKMHKRTEHKRHIPTPFIFR